MLSNPEEILEIVQKNRETRGVVMLCTLPSCPSCIVAEPEWLRTTEQIQGRHVLHHKLERERVPLFVKALAPAAILFLHTMRPTAIPPVLYFGPRNYARSSSVRELEQATQSLREAVASSAHDSMSTKSLVKSAKIWRRFAVISSTTVTQETQTTGTRPVRSSSSSSSSRSSQSSRKQSVLRQVLRMR